MSPREKLIAIVDAAKDDNLRAAEQAYEHLSRESMRAQSTGYWSTCDETRQQCLDRLRAERAEWQAARDLLTYLIGLHEGCKSRWKAEEEMIDRADELIEKAYPLKTQKPRL